MTVRGGCVGDFCKCRQPHPAIQPLRRGGARGRSGGDERGVGGGPVRAGMSRALTPRARFDERLPNRHDSWSGRAACKTRLALGE